MPIKQMQWQLLVLGFYPDYNPNRADGKWGADSVRAFNSWQRSVGRSETPMYSTIDIVLIRQQVIDLQVSLGFSGEEIDGFGGPKTLEAKTAAEKPKPAPEQPEEPSAPDTEPTPVDFWSTIRHFERHEFKCGCHGRYCNGFTHEPNHDLVKLVDNVREHFGQPITVTSGLRCPDYNAELDDSSPNSKHMDGIAADIVVHGVSPAEVYRYIESLMPNCGGLGKYTGHVHVDVRPNRSRW